MLRFCFKLFVTPFSVEFVHVVDNVRCDIKLFVCHQNIVTLLR